MYPSEKVNQIYSKIPRTKILNNTIQYYVAVYPPWGKEEKLLY